MANYGSKTAILAIAPIADTPKIGLVSVRINAFLPPPTTK